MDKPETTKNDERRPYAKPRLQVYGDVREITLAVGNMGTDDGGMAPQHKTQ